MSRLFAIHEGPEAPDLNPSFVRLFTYTLKAATASKTSRRARNSALNAALRGLLSGTSPALVPSQQEPTRNPDVSVP